MISHKNKKRGWCEEKYGRCIFRKFKSIIGLVKWVLRCSILNYNYLATIRNWDLKVWSRLPIFFRILSQNIAVIVGALSVKQKNGSFYAFKVISHLKRFASVLLRTGNEWNYLPLDLFPDNMSLFMVKVNRHLFD